MAIQIPSSPNVCCCLTWGNKTSATLDKKRKKKHHITNDEVMTHSGQTALHDIVAMRRRRLIGHIL